jgi:hypothetical protein
MRQPRLTPFFGYGKAGKCYFIGDLGNPIAFALRCSPSTYYLALLDLYKRDRKNNGLNTLLSLTCPKTKGLILIALGFRPHIY